MPGVGVGVTSEMIEVLEIDGHTYFLAFAPNTVTPDEWLGIRDAIQALNLGWS